MNQNRLFRCLAVLSVCLTATTTSAVTILFEGLADSASVGSTYNGLGVTFAGATVLTGGISLNEFDFPPRSGDNVVFDDGGPLSGVFTTPVNSISAYLTYSSPVTLSAYGVGGALLGSVTSVASENYVSSGGTPNELLMLSFATEIKSFSFIGTPAGSSFTLDDFSFNQHTSVPESGTSFVLLGTSVAVLPFLRRLTRSRTRNS